MKRQSRSIYRWFGVSIFVILIMSSWINGLYDDISGKNFDIEIYKTRGHDYDSILRIRNYTIDSLKKSTYKVKEEPVIIPKKYKKLPIDTISKDTLYLPLDTFKLKPIIDTIK